MLDRGSRVMAVGLTLLVFLGLCYFFSLARPGLGTFWKQEQAPPEPVIALELDPNGELLAIAASGNRFRNSPLSGHPWEKYEGPAEFNRYGVYCFEEGGGSYIILPAPGNVVSRVSEGCGATESAYHVEVALLENGEIWSWVYGSSALRNALLPLYLCAGAAMAAVVFLIGLGLKFHDS